MAMQPSDALAFREDGRPTLADLQGDNYYSTTAKTNWFRPDGPQARFSPQVVKQIYHALERDLFSTKSLLLLENLQYMERYLWPNYDEDSSDELVISMVMMIAAKKREALPVWALFESSSGPFPSFFRRVLIMSITISLPIIPRTHILTFISCAFQSLDSSLVRKECAPLVSIGIWQNFHSDSSREAKMEDQPLFKKAWRASAKKFASVDQKTQSKMKFERTWLYLLLLDFISIIYHDKLDEESMIYAERVVEFLTDVLSQIPTRRYVHGLLEDLQIIPCIKLSALYTNPGNRLFRDIFALFEHFFHFHDDDVDEPKEPYNRHRNHLARLQRLSLRVSKQKLMVLGLANHSSISGKDDILQHLVLLDDNELRHLTQLLHFRTSYPKDVRCRIDREFMLFAIAEAFMRKPDPSEEVKGSTLFPDEESIFSKSYLRSGYYDGTRPLALPKANLQYLSMIDFLWRMFFLYRAESFFEIRSDLQDTIRRLKPSVHGGNTIFRGTSKMALRINRISILEIATPRVGETLPAHVRAEIDLPLDTLSGDLRREWESLRPDDVVYLLRVGARDSNAAMKQQDPEDSSAESLGISLLRCAEVIQSIGEYRHVGNSSGSERRKLQVKLDRVAYLMDKERSTDHEDIYGSLNLIIRRKGIENNFKPILASIQSLIQQSENIIPSWLKDTFLGYGDPAEACFPILQPRPKSLNFRDTFSDEKHLQDTFQALPFGLSFKNPHSTPPFIFTEKNTNSGETDSAGDKFQISYEVSTHKHEIFRPYVKPIKDTYIVKYTSAQVNAIISGTNPGITLVIGPPGTGKTDVATQIITNLYHNFPQERILVIAHSNQALNQIFQKIAIRDIDERHLLRLGHGEEELKNDSSYSKHGRIESLIDRRNKLLQEVDRLAISIGAPGAHGNSCETAYYFNKVYVQPLVESFRVSMSKLAIIEQIRTRFPFSEFFLGTPNPVFANLKSHEDAVAVVEGCFKHIAQIFEELEDMMPFEVLRNSRDRASYLLTKEARIIAMTSTHAAIKRDEIVRQGFQYDSVVMEEAAQVTEIEAFIPLTLQAASKTRSGVKRIVLCGDHMQNSPVIQNSAFRSFANLEQSLFARFVRLGIPAITLDRQGRTRPSIASLYNWRYPKLGNLDYVSKSEEFIHANAGFRHEFQFINVEDFKGNGEQQPSPHFIQNLGEAEFAVALFQYMRLLGYPASKISILSSYAGQRALIRDILNHRCAQNPIFGLPAHITTIDKFQGEQNDYVILSLVRTTRVGYLRDMRRLTVALSRARLGLYILGRLGIFEICYELKDAFSRLLQKPTKLELITGEMWPTERLLSASPPATVMEGLEHLGQYVYEMTQTKQASMK